MTAERLRAHLFAGSVWTICWAVSGTISWKATEMRSGLAGGRDGSAQHTSRTNVAARKETHSEAAEEHTRGKTSASASRGSEELGGAPLGGKSQGSRSSAGDLPLRFHVQQWTDTLWFERNSDDLSSMMARCFSSSGSWISIGFWSARMPWEQRGGWEGCQSRASAGGG